MKITLEIIYQSIIHFAFARIHAHLGGNLTILYLYTQLFNCPIFSRIPYLVALCWTTILRFWFALSIIVASRWPYRWHHQSLAPMPCRLS